jgi:hypothetical protein
LRPTRGFNLRHIVCLNFWYIYHMGLQQLSHAQQQVSMAPEGQVPYHLPYCCHECREK